VFGEDAHTYDEARPSYPDAVIDLVVADEPATAVDVGCGTGKAATLVAARNVDVLGIEPDERMAAVARRHGVEVTVSRFEDWPAQPRDLVFSAQAWHWVDPARGAAKAAEVLAPGARWAGFWNWETDERLDDTLTRSYEQHAPALLTDRSRLASRSGMDDTLEGFAAVGGFEPMQRHEVFWSDTVTLDTLVARLSTSSSHRLLDPGVAARLHHAIAEDLADVGTGGHLELAYTTTILTARRRSRSDRS
jgi:SAM-dependent methyltransferase